MSVLGCLPHSAAPLILLSIIIFVNLLHKWTHCSNQQIMNRFDIWSFLLLLSWVLGHSRVSWCDPLKSIRYGKRLQSPFFHWRQRLGFCHEFHCSQQKLSLWLQARNRTRLSVLLAQLLTVMCCRAVLSVVNCDVLAGSAVNCCCLSHRACSPESASTRAQLLLHTCLAVPPACNTAVSLQLSFMPCCANQSPNTCRTLLARSCFLAQMIT